MTNLSELLNVAAITKSFGGLTAVNGISLSVEPGEIVGLIGPNGSGKSTTLNLIAGVLSPDSGNIKVRGVDVTRMPTYQRVRLRINRTFQLVRVPPGLTVWENVRVGALYGADRLSISAADLKTRAVLKYFNLEEKADSTGAQLTYIDQKRVELARAWATNPLVLLLDEWLAGLNPTELEEGIAIVRRLAAEGVGIILVEHVMPAVRALCDRLLVMSAGRQIAAGTTDRVLRDVAVREAYLGRDDAQS